MSIVDIAREKALEQGIGLNEEELLQVLQIPDEQLEESDRIKEQILMMENEMWNY